MIEYDSSLIKIKDILNMPLSVDLLSNKWQPNQKSSFIESMMINMPLMPITIIKNEIISDWQEERYEIVDGHNRILTLKEFCNDQFTYNNLRYSELSSDIKAKIDNRIITVISILKSSISIDITRNRINGVIF